MERLAYTLTLADGTELDGSCGLAGRSLWCWVNNKTMADCFVLFTDPEKTKEITILYTVTGYRYKGFTILELIKTGTDALGNETIDVKLTWPEGGEHSVEEFEIDRKKQEGGMSDAEVS